MQLTAAYTYSHLIDDTTAEVNTRFSARDVLRISITGEQSEPTLLLIAVTLCYSFIYEVPLGRTTYKYVKGFVVVEFSGTYTLSQVRERQLSGTDQT